MTDYTVETHVSRDDVVSMLTNDVEQTVYVLINVAQRILNARGTYDYDCICNAMGALDEDERQDWRDFMEAMESALQ